MARRRFSGHRVGGTTANTPFLATLGPGFQSDIVGHVVVFYFQTKKKRPRSVTNTADKTIMEWPFCTAGENCSGYRGSLSEDPLQSMFSAPSTRRTKRETTKPTSVAMGGSCGRRGLSPSGLSPSGLSPSGLSSSGLSPSAGLAPNVGPSTAARYYSQSLGVRTRAGGNERGVEPLGDTKNFENMLFGQKETSAPPRPRDVISPKVLVLPPPSRAQPLKLSATASTDHPSPPPQSSPQTPPPPQTSSPQTVSLLEKTFGICTTGQKDTLAPIEVFKKQLQKRQEQFQKDMKDLASAYKEDMVRLNHAEAQKLEATREQCKHMIEQVTQGCKHMIHGDGTAYCPPNGPPLVQKWSSDGTYDQESSVSFNQESSVSFNQESMSSPVSKTSGWLSTNVIPLVNTLPDQPSNNIMDVYVS
jgi:hypothetical protein